MVLLKKKGTMKKKCGTMDQNYDIIPKTQRDF